MNASSYLSLSIKMSSYVVFLAFVKFILYLSSFWFLGCRCRTATLADWTAVLKLTADSSTASFFSSLFSYLLGFLWSYRSELRSFPSFPSPLSCDPDPEFLLSCFLLLFLADFFKISGLKLIYKIFFLFSFIIPFSPGFLNNLLVISSNYLAPLLPLLS